MEHVTDKLVIFVIEFEGFLSVPYWDVDHWSHGYGTNASGQHAPPISKEDARQELRRELNEVVPSIPRLGRLRQHEVDACASFGYNLGTRVLVDEEFSTFAERMQSGEGKDFDDRRGIYHDELRKWVSPGTIYEAGLTRRRIAETHLARNGDYTP